MQLIPNLFWCPYLPDAVIPQKYPHPFTIKIMSLFQGKTLEPTEVEIAHGTGHTWYVLMDKCQVDMEKYLETKGIPKVLILSQSYPLHLIYLP